MKSLILIALSAAAAFGQTAAYTIDASHSIAGFSVKHMMVSNVKGTFSKMSGSISYDPKNLAASSVEASIDVTSIDTREPKRDEHLKSADFFDAAKFPTITFKSKQFMKSGAGLKIKGDLTIHGVTKEVILDVEAPSAEVEAPKGVGRIGATATVKIDRREFGLTWSRALETGGLVVGNEVTITLEIEATRKKA